MLKNVETLAYIKEKVYICSVKIKKICLTVLRGTLKFKVMRVKLVLLSTDDDLNVIEKLFQVMYDGHFQFLQKLKSEIDTDCVFIYELDKEVYQKNCWDVFIKFLQESRIIRNYFVV